MTLKEIRARKLQRQLLAASLFIHAGMNRREISEWLGICYQRGALIVNDGVKYARWYGYIL